MRHISSGSSSRSGWPRILGLILLLAALYAVLARLGLTLATVGRSVTLVWPPTGLALVFVYLHGWRLGAGVFLGALIINATTPGVPVAAAVGMATGNTAEAMLGAWLLRAASFRPALRRPRDGLALIVLAAGVSTIASATLGPLSLWLGGVIPRSALFEAARAWWLGDLMGNLVVAPLLFVWLSPEAERRWSSILEGALLLLSLLTVTFLVFTHPLIFLLAAQPYAVFPFLIWAALRLGPRGSVSANFLVSTVSVWATAGGQGPFARPALSESLLLLQAFMAVVSVTSLIMGATAAERADALRAREDFISVASHEMRTPLTALHLQVRRMLRLIDRSEKAGPGATPPEDFATGLEMAERQVNRLAHTTEVLLDLTRLRSESLPLSKTRTDLVGLIRDAVESLGPVAREAQSPLRIEADGADTIVGEWDGVRLQQVIINLIDNAIKFGSGKPITITARSDGRAAVFTVRDEGPGIDPADRERIFHRFERGHRPPPGAGLGLHIAREIIEAHGGEIRAESHPDGGAMFQVTLPLPRPRLRP